MCGKRQAQDEGEEAADSAACVVVAGITLRENSTAVMGSRPV
jgi:hypothetical protein